MLLQKTAFVGIFIALAATSGLRALDAEYPPQRYALLIGVNEYTHLSNLRYCDNDMRALQQAFVKAGFPEKNVTLMHGGSRRAELLPFRNNVIEQLKILLGGVRKNDLVVVAFSGHGVHLGGKDYFCTTDTSLEDPAATMVPVETVYQLLQDGQAQQKLLVVDACRNNPLPEDTRAAADNTLVTSFQRSIAKKDKASQGIVVMASCAENQVSIEDPQLQRGVFMNFVVNGLLGHADANRDKEVTLLELHMYAEYETRNHVRVSRSMLQTPNLRGDITGNYIMARVSERPAELDLQTVGNAGAGSDGPSKIEMKLYDAAYGLFQQGKTADAIREFEQLVSLAENPQLKRVARLKLASAYLTLDPQRNIGKALAIHQQAGMDGVSVVVQNSNAPIKSGNDVRGTVKQGQVVAISEVKGDFYRVKSVDGKELPKEESGFLYKTAFQKPQPKTTPASNGGNNQVVYDPGYGYGYGDGAREVIREALAGPGGFVNPADAAAIRDLERRYDELDRLERRGVGPLQLRAKEREFERKAMELERKALQREAVRNFFRGGR